MYLETKTEEVKTYPIKYYYDLFESQAVCNELHVTCANCLEFFYSHTTKSPARICYKEHKISSLYSNKVI